MYEDVDGFSILKIAWTQHGSLDAFCREAWWSAPATTALPRCCHGQRSLRSAFHRPKLWDHPLGLLAFPSILTSKILRQISFPLPKQLLDTSPESRKQAMVCSKW